MPIIAEIGTGYVFGADERDAVAHHAVFINFNFADFIALAKRGFYMLCQHVESYIGLFIAGAEHKTVPFGADADALFSAERNRQFVVQINVFIEYHFIAIICKTIVKKTYRRIEPVVAGRTAEHDRNEAQVIL